MKCRIPHCGKPVVVKADRLCSGHYQKQWKYGDPTVVKQKQHHGKTLQERFDLYTKRGDGCWLWVGYRDPNGYGRLNIDGRPALASRISYQLHYGDIPEGKCVCHKCDNPPCVNPDHLFLGAQAANVADMHAKNRARKRGLKGEEHHQAVLTERDVRAIRASDLSEVKEAQKYGVSPTTVGDIRRRRIWKHVE